LPVSEHFLISTLLAGSVQAWKDLTVYETAIARNYTVLESQILCLLPQKTESRLLLLSKMETVGGRGLLLIVPIESQS
jgi:hypothetical protein